MISAVFIHGGKRGMAEGHAPFLCQNRKRERKKHAGQLSGVF